MKTEKKEQVGSAASRVAETFLDVAVGGTALAVDKAIETLDKAAERGEEMARRGSQTLYEKAQSAASEARDAVRGPDARAYEDRTRDDLYRLAAERGIEGRSRMRKAELIDALRAKN